MIGVGWRGCIAFMYRMIGWGGGAASPSSSGGRLDVERRDAGVLLDELAARLDLVAHELREELVGAGRVVQGDLGERRRGRVHRGLRELVGVHLAEALEAL